MRNKKPTVITLRDLLLDSTCKKREAENIPAILFRDMMSACGIGPAEWDKRMERYFRKVYGSDVKKINQEKTNLMRSLAKNKLTWTRYDTSIQIMGPVTYQFTLDMTFADGHTFRAIAKVRNRYRLTEEETLELSKLPLSMPYDETESQEDVQETDLSESVIHEDGKHDGNV